MPAFARAVGVDEVAEGRDAAPCFLTIEAAALKAADLTRQLLAYAGKGRYLVAEVELNAAALADLGVQVPAETTSGYSNSRTCEIGLSLHGGVPFQSIVYLVDRCTVAQ